MINLKAQTKLIDMINKGKTLVSDGAWGTLMHAKGLKAGECPELWNLTHRRDVLAIARGYILAGADMIMTNSFGASFFKLAHYRLEAKVAEINRAAAAISREAAGSDHLVLGSIGPTGKMLLMGDVTEQALSAAFTEQAGALYEGGSDAICIETMAALDEAALAVKAAKAATPLEVICTFTFDKTARGEYRTMMGVSPAQMAEQMIDAGADIIGTNCGNGMAGMIDIVKEIRSVNSTVPILVHANAGLPVFQDGRESFPETPEQTAGFVSDLKAAGANIIGGCCGTTPQHITAIKQVLAGL
jgi:5-methyltetrahydrofolate--homocysteine methyltransferase